MWWCVNSDVGAEKVLYYLCHKIAEGALNTN